MATVLDGKQLATAVRQGVARRVQAMHRRGIMPTLAVVLIGDDPASQVYIRNKTRACAEVGIVNVEVRLPTSATQDTVLEHLTRLNGDPAVHAVLVQLPLPRHIDTPTVLQTVSPRKDVDGFHPENVGRLYLGLPGPRPCTPLGIMALLTAAGIAAAGAHAVVVGRSAIVGKPTAALLTMADATVTVCHSQTRDVPTIIRSADIVVAAIGRPRYIQGEWIRRGATVVDVGINRLPDGTLVGDVDFATAQHHAAYITPVPGGVGPMTIAMLVQNTILLAERTEHAS